jgi:hypothetical protein
MSTHVHEEEIIMCKCGNHNNSMTSQGLSESGGAQFGTTLRGGVAAFATGASAFGCGSKCPVSGCNGYCNAKANEHQNGYHSDGDHFWK